ncbi:MAG TPA: cytochrome P450 [Streptosporangiaceae bacterium]|jgi:cytochrome P450
MESVTLPASYPIARTCPLDPAPEYELLRARPITRIRLDFDGSDVWLVTRYDDACAVLGDPRFSSDFSKAGFPARLTTQPPGPGTLIRMDPPDHTRLRRLLVPEFKRRRVEALRPRVQAITDELIDGMLAAGPPADLIADFALPLPSRVITELLGVPYEDREFFHQTTKVIGSQDTDPASRMKVRNELKAYLDRLVARKEADPAQDLLSLLSGQRERARVSRDEVVGMATLLMVAGYETVANQLGVGTIALLRQPGLLGELRRDPGLIGRCVEEIVRHQTVTDYGIRRACTADAVIGGQLIRAGEGVVVVTASANRDESRFPCPGQLDLTRTDHDHLAFGYGPHQCPGQLLARLQLTVAWTALLARLPQLRLAVELGDVPFRYDMFVYGVHELPVTW